MPEKIGEANVIHAFSKLITSELLSKNPDIQFVESIMSAKDDKTFGDYFAGLDANNILIEFKEFEKEIKTETKKPLRKILFDEIDKYRFTSRDCHHIGWRGDSSETIEIYLDNYIFKLSPFFDKNFENITTTKNKATDFINKFIQGEVGLKTSSFMSYIQFLKKLDHGDGNNGSHFFSAIIYSYQNNKLVQDVLSGDIVNILNIIEKKYQEERANHQTQNNLQQDTFFKSNSKKPGKKGGASKRMKYFVETQRKNQSLQSPKLK